MKFLSPVLVALLMTAASAQTRIGTVTLSAPAAPAPVLRRAPAPVPALPASAAPVRTSRSAPSQGNKAMNITDGAANSGRMSTIDVPAGSVEVKGRISAADNVTLPAGSMVSVSVHDLTRPAQVLEIKFKTTHLSTPYQVVFSGGRLSSTHNYAVTATVTDPSGKVLYRSDRSALLPKTNRATVNVSVR